MKKIMMQVMVKTQYVPEQSNPQEEKFVWSYEITLDNQSEHIIQLLARHWRITDLLGRVEEIDGIGVVGLQPIIKPGKTFTYTSFCQITTPQGTMEGHYEVQDLDEERFEIEIPKFVLSAPSPLVKAFQTRLH